MNELIVSRGDKVRYFLPDGEHIGTIERAEIRYGSTYATIKPDHRDDPIYLFHGAVAGFALIDEFIHPWSPLAMARLRGSVKCQK